jgi:GGDEF domain-containing protein
MAARYGDDEFVVLLPDTPPAGAARIAQKILAAIESLGIEHTGSEASSVCRHSSTSEPKPVWILRLPPVLDASRRTVAPGLAF